MNGEFSKEEIGMMRGDDPEPSIRRMLSFAERVEEFEQQDPDWVFRFAGYSDTEIAQLRRQGRCPHR